mgnify:CR=1 FL=1
MPLLRWRIRTKGWSKKYLDRGLMLGAFGDGQPAGVIVAVPLQEPGQWEIKNMAVAPRYWRRGIGTLLIEEIETVCPLIRIPSGWELGTLAQAPLLFTRAVAFTLIMYWKTFLWNIILNLLSKMENSAWICIT